MAGGPVVDDDDDKKDEKIRALDAGDIALLKTYVRMATPLCPPAAGYPPLPCLPQGQGPYNKSILKAEENLKSLNGKINDLVGIKESDTGLAPPAQWDLVSDKQMMQEEQPLQARALAPVTAPRRCATAHTRHRPPAGRALHQDHRREHGRHEVRDQREADRKVRGRARRPGRARGRGGGHARGRRPQ